jgi:hypothetical protein
VISCDLLIARSADDEASTATGNFATCSGEVEQVPVPIVNPIRWQLIENRAMLLLDV